MNSTVGHRGRGRAGRILLLDEAWTATHHVAHAFAVAGWEVRILSGVAGNPPARRLLGLPITRSAGEALGTPAWESAVAALVETWDPQVIYPLTERGAQHVWSSAPAWRERVFPVVADWQQPLLRDKHRLSAFVAARGVPVPRAHVVLEEADLERALADIALPAVVKGSAGVAGHHVHIVGDVGTARAAVGQELDFARDGACDGAPVLQEFVHGPVFLSGGLFEHGECVRYYACEKLELFPARTGPSIRVRSDDDPRLRELTLAVFRALRWTGVASADWVRGADGAYRFLEVNPRPWGSIAACLPSGVDVLGGLAALLLGHPVTPQLSPRPDVRLALLPQVALTRLERDGLPALCGLLGDRDAWRALRTTPRRLALRAAREVLYDVRRRAAALARSVASRVIAAPPDRDRTPRAARRVPAPESARRSTAPGA